MLWITPSLGDGTEGMKIMLFTIAVVLAVLWLLGFVSGTTMGGLIHILLVLAVIVVVFQLLSGRRVG
ncbi:lmo0937 family membrane protein [Wenzhouxiangella sp. XN201]|uniref:lmo0937 family membrane protein n=1 Tax=Wenzhouxiangella sp. XN201 TaxID=2710755 RepID=UPI001F09DB55|nr:lmo0937 family membrane protein [Wenzhouxiangella sp. XN201]